MKTMLLVATATLMMGSDAAFADGAGGGVPLAPFTIWQQEGAAGHPLTPMSATAPAAQPGATASAHLAPTATAQNGQTTHAYVTQPSRGTHLFQPAQNGGANN